MSLTPGTRLGPYEILSPLGAGGMGEVYRARDAKLNRDVAIKVLPEAVAEDAERLARFQREAQVLASLNHPHIAAIYGLEKAGHFEALVLELVEGETLPSGSGPGRFRWTRPSRSRGRSSDALEAAHEKGIVHRDLKPANVKITPEGKVKVLDFGLAKALTGDASSPDVSHSPTLDGAGDPGRRGHRDGGVHVARAGARQGRGQAGGHLGVRRGPVRDACRAQGLRRRDRVRHARRGAARRHRLVEPPVADASGRARSSAPLSRPRPEAPSP